MWCNKLYNNIIHLILFVLLFWLFSLFIQINTKLSMIGETILSSVPCAIYKCTNNFQIERYLTLFLYLLFKMMNVIIFNHLENITINGIFSIGFIFMTDICTDPSKPSFSACSRIRSRISRRNPSRFSWM